jgi:hypothetical protein
MNRGCKMNEQLLKIAQQAGLTLSVDQQVAFQRAAEALVRQCISMVLPYNEDEPNAEKLYELADAIGEHFGVEE